MSPDPRRTLVRWYYGHKLVSIVIDHALELRGETIDSAFPQGLPPDEDHDRWEHDVYRLKPQNPLDTPQEFEHVGRFTNLGKAIDAARLDSEQMAKAAAVPATPVSAPPEPAPAAAVTNETLLESAPADTQDPDSQDGEKK